MSNKSMYRCVVSFTDEALASTRPSILFLRAVSSDDAMRGAKCTFDAECRKHDLIGAKYNIEVYASTEKEAEVYRQSMKNRVN